MDEKTKESQQLAEEKTNEAKERAERRVPEYKSCAVEKLIEKKNDSTNAERLPIEYKAEEGKDNLVGKIGDTAKRAMDFFVGEKEEISGSPKEKYQKPEHEARRMMQELKLKEEGYEDEGRKRAEADRETAQNRGITGKRNIISMMPSLTESIKSKFVMPSDIVVETRARQEGLDKVVEDVATDRKNKTAE